ncbi:MAG TPA: FtsX-like permease family protein [Gemmatimonadaceae bacterium]|nr:FtsX-like permease family protein [Gemmatimonadaceae bacterium]
MIHLLTALMLLQGPVPAGMAQPRTIAIDEAFAQAAGLRIGDHLTLSAKPGTEDSGSEPVVVGAIYERSADPSEIARGDYKMRLHLDQLQRISGYGDRVDRFAMETAPAADIGRVIERVNRQAFGFRAYRSRDIAVETSRTFLVVSRFHRAIGVITIVASSVFLLCIMVLKVEERRRDIAALRLMGISRSSVVQSIVIEAGVVAVLGSMLGVLIGWVVSLFVNSHYQALYQTPLEFSIVTVPIVVFAVSLSLVLGIAAGLAASWRLVRTPPLTLFGR